MPKKPIKVKQLLVVNPKEFYFESTSDFFKHFGYIGNQSTSDRIMERGWFSPKNTQDLYQVWRDGDIEEKIEELELQLARLRKRRENARAYHN